MRMLFFGDIVGKPGRLALKEHLPRLRQEYGADFVIANGENASGGIGITAETCRELLNLGIDVLTTGNHIWKHKDIYSALQRESRLLRPANFPEITNAYGVEGATVSGAVGRGLGIYDIAGVQIAVINLMGRTYMNSLDCPFRKADELLATIPDSVKVRFVDFHAEASSEKKALGWYLDGRVSAVVGTHTHVQTADAMLLDKGTAYLTDAGMCGAEASVLGMDKTVIINKFLTHVPQKFKPENGRGSLNGVAMDIDEATGMARSIELIRVACPPAALNV
ncbi:MAG: TIGR00282 family metallophosphoesterase [Pseudomonadota bacterium]